MIAEYPIAEPWICVEGESLGAVCWSITPDWDGISKINGSKWQRYADFEREKLRDLQKAIRAEECFIEINGNTFLFSCFYKNGDGTHCDSEYLIDYDDYLEDTESNRLLKRAEFLKAVCEKEGVEWLPECEHVYPALRKQECVQCGKPKETDMKIGVDWGKEAGDSSGMLGLLKRTIPGGAGRKPATGGIVNEPFDLFPDPPPFNVIPQKETDIVEEMCGEEECKCGNSEGFELSNCANCGGLIPKYGFYTKQEIDERFRLLWHIARKMHGKKRTLIWGLLDHFRSRFL